ncbi:integrase catalytic domain-containing protein [Trichonephila clavipes]|nr:integrase catalytic domain-containing protein [Trichonephila clavipes]
MQYLLQSVEPKSKAERLVLSFPATAENYPKAIDQLKGKLRSLESLGRTQEKYGDFLTPLVESCLPEEILMAWERKRNTETDAKGSRTLEHLMTFLRLEVQGEEMVQLAKSGFGTPIRKRDSPTERVKPTELMTASALASSEKSSVLSTVQKVFDPIGMLAPSTLLPKLLLQEIWKMKIAWDQELPQNIVNKFMKWFNEIQILKDVTVPRCMKIDIFTELHVFVEASKGSYAGCVFARSIVVRAKSRVAPLKLLSLPCLELMTCCVGARLVNSILKALNMPDLKVTLLVRFHNSTLVD